MNLRALIIATSLVFRILPSHACNDCEIDQRRQEMSSLLSLSNCSIWGPMLISKKDHYELQISAPGFDKSDIKVTTEGDTLTVRGEKKKIPQSEDKVLFGNSQQSFIYQFPLGQDIMVSTLKASLKNGVLSATVQKDPKKAEKIIQVQ